jgi:hypothetical protein
MILLIRVPLGRRQVTAQFFCRSARTVARGVALDTPPLFQRAYREWREHRHRQERDRTDPLIHRVPQRERCLESHRTSDRFAGIHEKSQVMRGEARLIWSCPWLAGQLEISASDFGVDRIKLSTPAAELSRIASKCPSAGISIPAACASPGDTQHSPRNHPRAPRSRDIYLLMRSDSTSVALVKVYFLGCSKDTCDQQMTRTAYFAAQPRSPIVHFRLSFDSA